ncbi:uncharacterized protein STEHIDRAFT_63751 [Stereum hirsutum FP-91666 SS1]|uniref:uncharacterized protein n=1 Tax=Stereum hirsutum (strain FP-91666) TaxID=721885 RepID=UPI0004449C4A|nr:uncharacterized protein STEHIDRAFT_63751 [Stereum hirsutum FP-91666 SS1]EIM82792.1 hypothetical protein STEHIDRAFT_63751 [Stereum hirsutum FP-91666 SS1]
MASLWPRPNLVAAAAASPASDGLLQLLRAEGFEREGDKVYLAPEVLQGCYGKAADIFSLGMTMLETASNIVVPGECVTSIETVRKHLTDCVPHLPFFTFGIAYSSFIHSPGPVWPFRLTRNPRHSASLNVLSSHDLPRHHHLYAT